MNMKKMLCCGMTMVMLAFSAMSACAEDELPRFDSQADAEWKTAYDARVRNMIDTNGLNWLSDSFNYALIWVNDDDIPELVIDTMNESSGCIVLTYSGDAGVMPMYTEGRGFTYIERGNRLLNSDGRDGYGWDVIYSIQDGYWKILGRGERGNGYEWRFESVSEQTYRENMAQLYDSASAIVPERWYTSGELLTILEN